jgi:hypothetical protein
MQIHGRDVRRMADLDLVDAHARHAQSLERFLESLTHIVVQQIAEVRARHREPEAVHGHLRRDGLGWIAEQRVVDEAGVGHGLGKRTHVVQRLRQRHYSVGRNFAERRQTDHAAGRGGEYGSSRRCRCQSWRAPCRRPRWLRTHRSNRPATAWGRADCGPARTRNPRSSFRTRTRGGWSCRGTPRRPARDA